jgi:hydrophobic/amphiphilic exporter-1 (mainly G- bacteria), HAE1 family
LSNFATINVVDVLSRIPGVGNVTVFGAGQYSMRIWLDPNKLNARDLTPQDVINAVQAQSQQVTGGQVGAPPAPAGQAFQYTVNVEGRLTDPAAFGNIVVKAANGSGGQFTRLRDVARVELGAQTYAQSFKANDQPAAGIAIFLSPNANALAVAAAVRAKMTELARGFPQGLSWDIPFDTTKFVQASIGEVYRTLFEAAVLVLLVIMVFLQDWRATLVPASTVPVTIIGAFALMAVLGSTVNLSTLFALVLSIGIVVDDAIVVVEAATQHLERGLSAHDAAVRAMQELFGPIIGITLVLMSVFVPAAFLPGLTGQMYAQFAIVIAATALLSAINAATLKPTQCALWLRPPKPLAERNILFRSFNRVYSPIERRYTSLIRHMAGHAHGLALLALIVGGLGVWGIARLPTAFIPIEDQGYLVLDLQLPDGASLERTQVALDKATAIARATPGVAQAIEIAGISPLDNNASLASAGAVYVVLQDWSERGRGEGLRAIYGHLVTALDQLTEASSFVIVPPPIQGIGNASGFTMMVEQRDGSDDFAKLSNVTQTVLRDAAGQPGLSHLVSTFRAGVPQIEVLVDRSKAEALGLSVGDVFAALSSYVGSSYINQFNKFGRTFQVYAQADSPYRLDTDDILHLMVRSQSGQMVPLGSLAQVQPAVGPVLLTLYNLYPAATIVGAPAPGYSSGQAISIMEDLGNKVLPRGTGYEWTAMSYQEKAVGGQIYLAFGLGLLLVYLCLSGQYESWIAPLSVILAVPLALSGPALALGVLGLANNLYTQIGLVLLIALSAKNAILIVEVARDRRRHEGVAIVAAAVEAARTRFRPIVMTSFAFILGVVPLVGATGAGAAARISLGLSVLTGMLASTCLTVLFVPSFFVVLQGLEERMRGPTRTVPVKDAVG